MGVDGVGDGPSSDRLSDDALLSTDGTWCGGCSTEAGSRGIDAGGAVVICLSRRSLNACWSCCSERRC
jgi:hypothetical protein